MTFLRRQIFSSLSILRHVYVAKIQSTCRTVPCISPLLKCLSGYHMVCPVLSTHGSQSKILLVSTVILPKSLTLNEITSFQNPLHISSGKDSHFAIFQLLVGNPCDICWRPGFHKAKYTHLFILLV